MSDENEWPSFIGEIKKAADKHNLRSSAVMPGYAYRRLHEGETILGTDEVQLADGTWGETICAGSKAPSPDYTSHRQYRRKLS